MRQWPENYIEFDESDDKQLTHNIASYRCLYPPMACFYSFGDSPADKKMVLCHKDKSIPCEWRKHIDRLDIIKDDLEQSLPMLQQLQCRFCRDKEKCDDDMEDLCLRDINNWVKGKAWL